MEIRVLGGEVGDLLREKIGFVGDGIVVEQARQVGRGDDGADVRAHLPPVGAVNVRRQHHETQRAGVLRRARHRYRLNRAERGDAEHRRRAPAERLHARAGDGDFLFEGKRGRFAERAAEHDAVAPGIDHPATMRRERRVVDREVGVEVSGNCRDDAFPVHEDLL